MFQLKFLDAYTASDQLRRLFNAKIKRGEKLELVPLGDRILIFRNSHRFAASPICAIYARRGQL